MPEIIEKRRGKRTKQERTSREHHTIEELFERFYSAKLAEGRAPRTLDQYKQNFACFVTYLDEKEILHDVSEINVVHNIECALYVINVQAKNVLNPRRHYQLKWRTLERLLAYGYA